MDLFSLRMETIEILFFMRPFPPLASPSSPLCPPPCFLFFSSFCLCSALRCFQLFQVRVYLLLEGGPFGPLAIRFWPIPWLWVCWSPFVGPQIRENLTPPAVSSKRLEDHSRPAWGKIRVLLLLVIIIALLLELFRVQNKHTPILRIVTILGVFLFAFRFEFWADSVIIGNFLRCRPNSHPAVQQSDMLWRRVVTKWHPSGGVRRKRISSRALKISRVGRSQRVADEVENEWR